MKICEQCSHTYPDDYAICPKCHFSALPAKKNTVALLPKKRSKTAFLKDFWGVAAVAFWIIGGGLSIFFLALSLFGNTVAFWPTLGSVINLLIFTFLLGFAAYTLSHILELLEKHKK